MIYIIVVVVVVYLVLNYIKFRNKMDYFEFVRGYFAEQGALNPFSDQVALKFANALVKTQQYKDAYDVYETLLLKGGLDGKTASEVECNMEFCKNPLPWVKELKNYSRSFLHGFMLVRFGRRRYNHITDDDYLLINSMMRSME